MDLHAPVQYVKGIGPQRAEALAKAGVRTAEDLLLHLPMRYEDRRSFARVADLRPGMRVSVSGEIAVAGLRRARRLTIYEVRLDDGSGRLKAVFFNQPYLRETLAAGRKVVFYGLVERDAVGSRLLVDALARSTRSSRGTSTAASTPDASCRSTRSSARSPSSRCGGSSPTSRSRCRPTFPTRSPPSCASGSR